MVSVRDVLGAGGCATAQQLTSAQDLRALVVVVTLTTTTLPTGDVIVTTQILLLILGLGQPPLSC